MSGVQPYVQTRTIIEAVEGREIEVLKALEAQSGAPVLALCRALIATGIDPATPMHVYRGATLALLVRSIGAAAVLDVVDGRFQKWHPRKPSAASPIAQTARPPARVRPDASEALGRARAPPRGTHCDRFCDPQTTEGRDQGRDLPKYAPARADVQGGS
jgi:hypothetical protein